MIKTPDRYNIGDYVLIRKNRYKGSFGRIAAVDLSVPTVLVSLAGDEDINIFKDPDDIEVLTTVSEDDPEVVQTTGEPRTGPLEILETDGPWDVTVKVLTGEHAGSEGELIGPNKVMSDQLDDTILNVRLTNGRLITVGIRSFDFVFDGVNDG